ncbi:MAG: oligosaccharide flippase family protein [Lachnospiraceae bacterium]|nr:oligosaccharide flippase family protein [Lachnospiraceae bacterium]
MNSRLGQSHSRTTNTIFNFTSSIGGQMVVMIMNFVVRTFFIQTLGKQYLGINGLFSNILTMLSLAEMGVGSAILFKLYEPLAKKDEHRITVLMKFYKTAYRYIGIAVAAVGLCLVPFLPYMIKNYDHLLELNIRPAVIFLLYLLNSVSSYLFLAYKSAIIKADQKEYIITFISYIVTVARGVTQIIALVAGGPFELYVGISIFYVIVQNIIFALLADKMYPYINDRTDDKLSREETRGILKDCTALFIYKLNTVVLKSTDNLVLSVFLGLEMVGLYSNYYIFYTTIQTLFAKIFNAVSHSLGNLHTTKDRQHEYRIFKVVNLITVIMGGTAFIGIFVVADEFIRTWIGSEWVLEQPFSFIMGLELYTMAIRTALGKYRATMGLFQQAKYRPLAGMVINIVLSVALVGKMGISGVILATVIADWTTFMWYDPIIIHRHGFAGEFPVSGYFAVNGKYLLLILLTGAVDYYVCARFLTGMGWISVIVHALICGVTVPAVLLAAELRTEQGKYVRAMIMRYVRPLMRRFQ